MEELVGSAVLYVRYNYSESLGDAFFFTSMLVDYSIYDLRRFSKHPEETRHTQLNVRTIIFHSAR